MRHERANARERTIFIERRRASDRPETTTLYAVVVAFLRVLSEAADAAHDVRSTDLPPYRTETIH